MDTRGDCKTQNAKPKQTQKNKLKNCSHVCAYHCAQLSYTTQHRAVLSIISLLGLLLIASSDCR